MSKLDELKQDYPTMQTAGLVYSAKVEIEVRKHRSTSCKNDIIYTRNFTNLCNGDKVKMGRIDFEEIDKIGTGFDIYESNRQNFPVLE